MLDLRQDWPHLLVYFALVLLIVHVYTPCKEHINTFIFIIVVMEGGTVSVCSKSIPRPGWLYLFPRSPTALREESLNRAIAFGRWLKECMTGGEWAGSAYIR